ncbi:type II secretion system F family protein [Streptomyces sp. N2-109]|uniref:Type II secretion system F family protein n=1 Tax=Streptomyces gossypii TaxID=2883101 RepID=A0ABT2JVW3_9ACTN|nr:type II secretion system F family protein [Streptomyces gossypii]MCT2592010.1 type II secretion system F family protein [Streptomyces gossypii]
MVPLLLGLLAAVATLGILTGIRLYRTEAELPRDLALALEVGASRAKTREQAVDRLGMRFAPAVLRLMGPKLIDKKRRKIDQAGNPGGLTLDRYAARRAVYGIFGALMALVGLAADSLVFAGLTLAFGWIAADLSLAQAIKERKRVIERTLPDFLDVLAVVVSAGLSFRQALDRVAERYEGPWADELHITLRQMDMGVSRREAFNQLRRRNASEQVDQFVTALQQGEELGAPIADTLVQIATDMRRTDAQNARRQAAKTVPKATIATIAFLLPGTLILIVATFILGSDTDFGSILDG